MMKRKGLPLAQWFVILVMSCIAVHAEAEGVAKKEERWSVVSTDYGHISAVRVSDGINASYLLHFFTLEPDSVLLPVVLNADMLFYVSAGSGRLRWTEEDEVKRIELRRGNVQRLLRGTVLYIRAQTRLKIHAIFANSNHDLREPETVLGPYSSIQEMVIGFDRRILQATFKVSEEVIDELLGGAKPPLITHADEFHDDDDLVVEMNKKKKKEKEKEKEKKKGKEDERLFNVFEADKEIENCNGWSTMVTGNQLPALEGSDISIFMVNLTAGSMMGPHWNSLESEIVVVLEGRGVVGVNSEGREMRMEVVQGDVVAVPKFQPMAHMSFNNGSFVLMGFTRVTQWSKPQFVGGESSLLQILNKQLLQLAFNVERKTLDDLLAPREDSEVISPCISCAEQEMQMQMQMKEEEEEEEEGGWRRGGEQEEENHHKKQGGLRRIILKKRLMN